MSPTPTLRTGARVLARPHTLARPYAVGRPLARLSIARALVAAAAALALLAGRARADDPAWTDRKGVIHCHSHFSHDSDGSAERIQAAAEEAGLDFLVMTDHQNDPRSVTDGLRGRHGRTLFIVGAEVGVGGGGSLLALDLARQVAGADKAARIADTLAQGGQAWVGHAEAWESWELDGVTGVELVNLHYDALKEDPLRVARGLARAARYVATDRERALKQVIDRPDPLIARWDAITRRRRFPIIAGNDAHENIRVLGLQLDPYPLALRAVNTHVLVQGELTVESLREALAEGRGYLCHELFAEGTGLVCEARTAEGARWAMLGEERPFAPGLALRVEAPHASRARLFLDGRLIAAPPAEARAWTFPLATAGVYRLELTIADAADGGRVRPWIYTNPIYLRRDPRGVPF